MTTTEGDSNTTLTSVRGLITNWEYRNFHHVNLGDCLRVNIAASPN